MKSLRTAACWGGNTDEMNMILEIVHLTRMIYYFET